MLSSAHSIPLETPCNRFSYTAADRARLFRERRIASKLSFNEVARRSGAAASDVVRAEDPAMNPSEFVIRWIGVTLGFFDEELESLVKAGK